MCAYVEFPCQHVILSKKFTTLALHTIVVTKMSLITYMWLRCFTLLTTSNDWPVDEKVGLHTGLDTVRTRVDVAVFASILRSNDRSHVCSAQRRKEAELSVQPGDFLGVGHHLTTRSRVSQTTPLWHKLSHNEQCLIHAQTRKLAWHNTSLRRYNENQRSADKHEPKSRFTVFLSYKRSREVTELVCC